MAKINKIKSKEWKSFFYYAAKLTLFIWETEKKDLVLVI